MLSKSICLALACAVLVVAKDTPLVEEKKAEAPPNAHKRDQAVCNNQHCIAASHRLFTSMNLNADPCDDFNEFVCGKFQDEFILPEDKSNWNGFTPISELIYERGRGLLEREHDEKNDWPIFKQAKDYYKSCMNLEKLEELGVQPLLDRLQKFGGWPVLEGDKWDGEGYQWYDQVYQMGQNGFGKDYIFQLYVSTDDKNSSRRRVFLDQPSLGLSREYLVKGFEDEDVQHYFTLMKETAQLLGADPERAEKELAEVLRFELELAEASAPREERRNASKLYNPFTVGKYPSLPGHPPSWTEYVDNILYNVKYEPCETLIVNNPEYVKKASDILVKASPRTIANYLGWRASNSVMEYLNEAAREIRQKYKKALTGTASEPPRWRTCTSAVGFNTYSDANFRIPAATLYVREYFPKEAKEVILNMISYLRDSFRSIISELDWMDETTKESAQYKLSEVKQFIGYPDEILDQKKVEKHHKGIVIDPDDYLGNALRLVQWDRDHTYRRLRQPVDKFDWVDHSLVALVNAFYNPSINSIEFPAGILQGAFFNHKVPKALNFGAIGGVIGHEFTHGFDDQGRQYDFEGNLKEWWQGETKEKFLEKTKCVIDQYSNYHDEQVNLNLNGVNGQGENIADNGGIKEAYRAYEKYLEDVGGHEEVLPGHDFTPRQLFWISWGQIWCSKYRDGQLKKQILTGAHSPGMYRIIGPVSNMPNFARDFNCPVGSKMNPEERCTVW